MWLSQDKYFVFTSFPTSHLLFHFTGVCGLGWYDSSPRSLRIVSPRSLHDNSTGEATFETVNTEDIGDEAKTMHISQR